VLFPVQPNRRVVHSAQLSRPLPSLNRANRELDISKPIESGDHPNIGLRSRTIGPYQYVSALQTAKHAHPGSEAGTERRVPARHRLDDPALARGNRLLAGLRD